MKKIFFLLLFNSIFNFQNSLSAQNMSIEETKKILCSHKWFLRRFEEDGKMFTVPKDMQGMKMVFKTDGTLYLFFPDEKESEVTIENWTITKNQIKVENHIKKYAYNYILKDFIGYKLYLTLEDSPTFVLEQAEKIENTSRNEKGTIGQQIWTTENLNVDYFRNGDPIAEAKTSEEWKKAADNGQPAWCNNEHNKPEFGKLYNWYAINDPRGLAPKGWHVPSKNEVDVLIKFLGGSEKASAKMKTTEFWRNNGDGNAGGNNSSGFSAMPAGKRYVNGGFAEYNFGGYFWTTTLYNGGEKHAHHFIIQAGKGSLMNGQIALLGYGCSVRCVKDK